MTKKEFIDALAAKTGTSRASTDRPVGALIGIISDTLGKGNSLSLPGFGTFKCASVQRVLAEIPGRVKN